MAEKQAGCEAERVRKPIREKGSKDFAYCVSPRGGIFRFPELERKPAPPRPISKW